MNNNYKDYYKYNIKDIKELNKNYPWFSQKIEIETISKNKNTDFILHATGDADLNGRKYVALPSNITIDSQIKKKYNLM